MTEERANRMPPWHPLEACEATTLARLEESATPVSMPVGESVHASAALADGVTLLSEGVLRVFHALSADCQFTVKLLQAPNAIGVSEVVRGTAWGASVEALTKVEGFHLPAEAIREALKEDPRFCLAVLHDLAGKFESTVRASRALGFDGCEQRLIRVLLEYAEYFGRPGENGCVIKYPLSRQRLALEIGAARRSVDRALAALTTAKQLSLSPKGWQVLHDVESLRGRLMPSVVRGPPKEA